VVVEGLRWRCWILMLLLDAVLSRKERGHQRCEAAPPEPKSRKARREGFLKRPRIASFSLVGMARDRRGDSRRILDR
jgi:hypothetical protein